MKELNGILVVDKPEGWTSHDVVKKTKNMLNRVKIGHTGTLDPFATGVLILLVGQATKHARLFEHCTKRYYAEVIFGYATDTFDRTGAITFSGDPKTVKRPALLEAIKSLEGESEQIPPMYSAVKVHGQKLYHLARAGKTIERTPRKILIEHIEPTDIDLPKVCLDIKCSKGTYIRSLADRLGKLVGCPSHLSALRRTEIGDYSVDKAVDFLTVVESGDSDVLKQAILPVEIE